MATVDNPSGAHTDTLVTDNDDGTYSVSYTPFEEGIHTLSVKFGGDHIPGSPFKVGFCSTYALPNWLHIFNHLTLVMTST